MTRLQFNRYRVATLLSTLLVFVCWESSMAQRTAVNEASDYSGSVMMPHCNQCRIPELLKRLFNHPNELLKIHSKTSIERSFPGVVEGLTDVSQESGGAVLETAPARWTEGDRAVAIPYLIDVSVTFPGFSQANLVQAVEAGFDAWSEITGLLFRFEGFETFDRGADKYGSSMDGRIRIQMHDAYHIIDDVVGNDGNFHQLGEGGFRAASESFGEAVKTPGSGGRLGSQEFYRIFNSWVVLNHREAARITNQGMLESVVAHEIGHALGFEHSSDDLGETRQDRRQAIMYRLVHQDGRGAALNDWDRLTAAKGYPQDNTPPALPHPLFLDLLSYNPALDYLVELTPNSFLIKGSDLQSEPSELTVEVDTDRSNGGVLRSGMAFGQFRPVTDDGLVVWDPLLRFSGDTRSSPNGTSRLVFRITDGINASPWRSLYGISHSRETIPSPNLDGIADSWVETHYTSKGVAFRGPAYDTDGDGLNDLEEYLQRTDPNDALSNLVVSFTDAEQCVTRNPGDVISIKLRTNITTLRPIDIPFTLTGNASFATDFRFAPKIGNSIRLDPLNIGDPDRPGVTESEVRIRLAETISAGDRMVTITLGDLGTALVDSNNKNIGCK